MQTKKITAAKIVGERIVRYGVDKGETVELVNPASYPVFTLKAPYVILEELGIKIEKFSEASADGSMLLTGWRAKRRQKVPQEIKRLFPDAADPIGRFEGLIKVIAAGLSKQPLDTYQKGYKSPDGVPVSKELVERFMVAEVDADGAQLRAAGVKTWEYKEGGVTMRLVKFPDLEKTHFIPVVEKGTLEQVTVIPLLYLPKFLPEEHYEMYAADDGGRFALHNLALRYTSGDYVFPNGEKGEAMILIGGYHATSGTTQEYYVILWPEFYTDKEGQSKFIWRMMTTKTRIKFANGMPVPEEGELPKTIQAQKRLLTPSVAVLLEGVV